MATKGILGTEPPHLPAADSNPTDAAAGSSPKIKKHQTTSGIGQPTRPPAARREAGQKIEQALRASELSYRRLFETAKDGVLILEADTGRITNVNPFLTHLLGFSREEMIGKTVGELSPFKDIGSNQAMLARLQADGYARYEDLPLETRDGRKIATTTAP